MAVKLSKICNDLRLLASGRRAGLAEIRLPAMQPDAMTRPRGLHPERRRADRRRKGT